MTVAWIAGAAGSGGAWLRQRDTVAPGTVEERIVDATLVCIARWGLAKTALDDVAREAGISRATVYRLFPGGKEALVDAVARTEVRRHLEVVAARAAAAATLDEVLVALLHEAGCRLSHHGALRFLFTYEPELILPLLSFDAAEDVLAVARALATAHLARFLDEAPAARMAELCARTVISYVSWPSIDVDLTDEASVRRLVARFLLPAALAA